jgi:hypothetical protein
VLKWRDERRTEGSGTKAADAFACQVATIWDRIARLES